MKMSSVLRGSRLRLRTKKPHIECGLVLQDNYLILADIFQWQFQEHGGAMV